MESLISMVIISVVIGGCWSFFAFSTSQNKLELAEKHRRIVDLWHLSSEEYTETSLTTDLGSIIERTIKPESNNIIQVNYSVTHKGSMSTQVLTYYVKEE